MEAGEPQIHLQLREADLEWREVEGELVALDLRESRYLAINRTGGVLWADLAEGATRDQLIERLIEAFDIEHERAAEDVDAFTAALEARDLLTRERLDG